MKKIKNIDDIRRQYQRVCTLGEVYEMALSDLQDKFQDMIQSELGSLVEEYSSSLSALHSSVEEIVERQEGYYYDRSERWQESDAGQAYAEWKDEWDTFKDSLEGDDDLLPEIDLSMGEVVEEEEVPDEYPEQD